MANLLAHRKLVFPPFSNPLFLPIRSVVASSMCMMCVFVLFSIRNPASWRTRDVRSPGNSNSIPPPRISSPTLRRSRSRPLQIAFSAPSVRGVAPAPRARSVAASATKISRAKVPAELEKMNNTDNLPMNTFNSKKPFTATIRSVERMVGPNATGETVNIIIETKGDIPFVEGQSYSVIPPGTKVNSRGKEVPHGVRLYSIASSRYGDDFDGKTTTLCVRRATYWDPELKKEDPAKKGICSNFLCDAKPGTEILMTGPTGKILLMPDDPNAAVIMVATGTGIAPFRSFWRRMFFEDTPGYKFGGLAWLFMGAANKDCTLYDDEIADILATNPDQFRVDYALSREMTNQAGGKMYIQDKMAEYADEIFDLLDKGAYIYFCGLKGMMPGIQETLERVAKEKGLDWDKVFEEYKESGRWRVEVY